MKKYYSFFLVMLFLGSCTITKRHFNKGWHVEWNKQHATSTNDNPIESTVNTKYRSAETNEVTVDSIPVQTIISEQGIDLTTIPTSVSEVTTSDDQEFFIDDIKSIEEGENISKEKQLTPQDEEIKPENKSKRVVSIPLAIVLAILLISLCVMIGILMGGILVFLLEGLFINEISLGMVGISFGMLPMFYGVFHTFQLFNRKETTYDSVEERTLYYLLYSFLIILLLTLIIGMILFI